MKTRSLFAGIVLCLAMGHQVFGQMKSPVIDPNPCPFVVFINTSSGANFGGSIISNVYVLTVARCTYGESSWSVRYGSPVFGQMKVATTQVAITHPQYAPSVNAFNNNIGVLRMQSPFIFSATLSKASLHYFPTPVGVGDFYHFETSNIKNSLRLQETTTFTVFKSPLKCDTVAGAQNFLCFIHRDKCSNDDGGPIIDGHSGYDSQVAIQTSNLSKNTCVNNKLAEYPALSL